MKFFGVQVGPKNINDVRASLRCIANELATLSKQEIDLAIASRDEAKEFAKQAELATQRSNACSGRAGEARALATRVTLLSSNTQTGAPTNNETA